MSTSAKRIHAGLDRAKMIGYTQGYRAALTQALSLKRRCEVNEADGVDSLKQAIRAELKRKTK